MRPATARLRLPVVALAIAVLLIALGGVFPGCGRKSPVEPSPVCTVAITPASQEFTDAGGSGSVAVSAPAGCEWTSAASHEWIALGSAGTGNGNGTVAYTVRANAGTDPRSGIVTIGGQTHTVSQRGHVAPVECRPELSPASASFGKDAADGTFEVTVAGGCEWQAVSHAPWLVVSGSGRGSGPGIVAYSVTRNLTVEPRAATITVADRTFAVTQAGDTGICEYSVAPVQISPCMAATTLSATVTTQPACTWTATPDAPWVTVRSGSAGSGSGTITMTVGENYEAPRNARILVRWPTPTLGQNIRIDQAGCRYAVSRTAIAFEAAGGAGTFDVLQQSDPPTCGGPLQDRCVWSAVADVPWITVTGSSPRAGDDRVGFTVSANAGTEPRVGTITVRDQRVTVSQAGRS